MTQQLAPGRPPASVDAPLVLPLEALDRDSLPVAGGKAANLGELLRAGFPVPIGFCVTTGAYALAVQALDATLAPLLEALATTPADATERLAALAARVREAILAAPIPEAVVAAVRSAYDQLGPAAPVAVRSSATAEDLPFASFAGQQETFLNVLGEAAVLEAVRRCWASLWTDRAVAYRAANRIDHRQVRLAVVVQRMVEASVAGVLFTANPITGRRQQAVIDASPGLGEAVVSGAVNPDHFVVDTASGAILERRPGDRRVRIEALEGGGTRRLEGTEGQVDQSCLSDEQVRALARLGARVEAHFGAPQDVEWALDAEGRLWLVQARPITTLFPLPANPSGAFRVYFSVNVAQGVLRPLTPMGVQGLRLIGASVARLVGLPPRDPLAGPGIVVEAGYRLFLDMTAALRSPLGRRFARVAAPRVEARSAALLEDVLADPRLAPAEAPSWRQLSGVLRALWRTRLPLRLIQAQLHPTASLHAAVRGANATVAAISVPPATRTAERLALVEHVLFERGVSVPLRFLPLMAAGLGSLALAWRLLGDLATAAEFDVVLRGLPHNPTTEMDLRLWSLAQQVRADAAAARRLLEERPERLAAAYRSGALPPPLQQGLAAFLRDYGHRGVAEIDLGLPRWADDPTHILGALANYLRLEDEVEAPDAQFRRGAREAEAMVAELVRRAGRRGWWRGLLVRLLLRRGRLLAGTREAPKFYFVALMARAREQLLAVGAELARQGRLDAADDIFFLDLAEARAAVGGADLRALVGERRAGYQYELRRRHVPRLLLSDGTEPEAAAPAAPLAGQLSGTPASAGLATGPARVILDPLGARLEPGEILVAPSTDPGWTPLFLTAGGLVMEMGGPMSHGAVVAREYGIPAVVGVPGATERISSGQRLTLDGSRGTIRLDPDTGGSGAP